MPNEEALKRWEIGHQLFFLLLQGLIINHQRLAQALVTRDDVAARTAFRYGVRLFDGSAAAMVFAASMSKECYDYVRATMTPPKVPEGFSGTWSRDHRAMMKGLRELRRSLENLDPSLEEDHRNWVMALDRVYAAHILVCERFVGDAPSLALNQARSDHGMTAVNSLKHFRQRAMGLVSARHPISLGQEQGSC